jgi:hypothetical protein
VHFRESVRDDVDFPLRRLGEQTRHSVTPRLEVAPACELSDLFFQRGEVGRFLFEYSVWSTQRGKVGVQYTPLGAAGGPHHVAQFLELLLDLAGLTRNGMKEKGM